MAYTIDPGKHIKQVLVFYEDQMYKNPDWSTLPNDGVLLVKLFRMDGSQREMSGWDYYFKATGPNGPIYGYTNNVTDTIRYRNVTILRGKWSDDATFEAVRNAASKEATAFD
jgi:hypothetical protein